MDRSLFNPIGPLGSILIGIVFCVLHFTRVAPLGWLGLACVLGGLILLMVRIMNNKKRELK
ncbi:MAG: hypothetical protein ACE37H_09885 [Phycisphaeraceae bacterium]